MSTQHTPGPWIIEPKAARGNWLRDKSGDYVALVCSRNGKDEIEEDRNALLVASAPDMLAALNELLGKLEVMGGCNDHDMNGESIWPEFEAARAAIAKAEGTA